MLPVVYGLAPLHIPTFFYIDLMARGVFRPRAEYRDERVSIIIPCRDEEAVIGNTLKAILEDSELNKEVIVVDDGSTDNTSEVASKFSGVKVLRREEGGRGKWDALNYGIEAASNDIVCILDADSRPEPGAIQKLIPYLRDPRVSAACGIIKVRNADENWLTRMVQLEFAVANYLQQKKSMIRNYFPWMPGTITVIKKELALFPPSLVEDAELSGQLAERGFEIIVDVESAASELAPTNIKAYMRQRTRWARGGWALLKYHHNRKKLLNNMLNFFEKTQPIFAVGSWIIFIYGLYVKWYLLDIILTNLWILSAGTMLWLYINSANIFKLKVKKSTILAYFFASSILYLIVWLRSLLPLRSWHKTFRPRDFG
ncbi:MAG: glycosyltransferase family 2 protein [Candidatus Bathyarchaeia archaeon]|nr:glycosyltransferase family 2 protein [Candidatus Bathyarchaeota archaeon]